MRAAIFARRVVGAEGTKGGLWCSPVAKKSRQAVDFLLLYHLYPVSGKELRRPRDAVVGDAEDHVRALISARGEGIAVLEVDLGVPQYLEDAIERPRLVGYRHREHRGHR